VSYRRNDPAPFSLRNVFVFGRRLPTSVLGGAPLLEDGELGVLVGEEGWISFRIPRAITYRYSSIDGELRELILCLGDRAECSKLSSVWPA